MIWMQVLIGSTPGIQTKVQNCLHPWKLTWNPPKMEVWFIGSDDFPDVNCVDFEVKHVNLPEDKTNQGVTLLVFPARITAVKRSFPTAPGEYIYNTVTLPFFQQRSQKTQWFIPFWKQKHPEKLPISTYQSLRISELCQTSICDHHNIGQHCKVRTWPLRKIDHHFIFSAPSQGP